MTGGLPRRAAHPNRENSEGSSASGVSEASDLLLSSTYRRSLLRDHKYSPYAVDWRFLPEEALFVKDFVRYHLVHISNLMASSRYSTLWVKTLGSRISESIQTAKVLFVHIPKTGGTSISNVLYGRNLPHYTAAFWLETFGASVSGVPSFSVVRDPVERLVSAYKMARAGGTDIVAYSRFWRARLRGLHSFDAFVDHVFENRHKVTALPLDLRPQSMFIVDGAGAVLVDRLFTLNSRRGLPPQLSRWLAVPSIPHLNTTSSHKVEVTTATRRKIEELYHTDFEIYECVGVEGAMADIKGRRFPGARVG